MTVHHVRVGDVLRLERRAVDVDPALEYREIGVRSFGKGIFHKVPVAGVELGNKRVFRVEPGDLVLSNVFAWEGAIARATSGEVGMIGSHRFMTYVPKDDRIDPAWAEWFFLSEPGLELIRVASPGSAGRNRTLAVSRFEDTIIPLPGIDEQRHVVRRLEQVGKATKQLVEAMTRSARLLSAARVAFVSPDSLPLSERRSQGWREYSFRELTTEAGASERVDPTRTYRIAGVFSFGRGLIDRGVMDGGNTSYASFRTLRENDIVFSKLGAWEGAVSVVTPEFDGYSVSSEFPTFGIDEGVLVPRYLLGVVRAPWFWASMNAETRGSMARRKRISPDQFLETRISLPSTEQQQRVVSYLSALDRVAEAQSEAAARRDALIPSIMNREFAVYL